MLEGPIGARLVQQRVRAPQPGRLLPQLRAEGRAACRRGYHKPIMLAGGIGNIAAAHTPQGRTAGGHAAAAARRPGHADRHGRRRRLVDGRGREHRRPRLRLGAARQRRDRAPRAGGDRPLLAARRRQPDPVDPRRRRRRAVERAARDRARRPGAARGSTCAPRRREDSGMSPREIWCNEAQERYVLAIAPRVARALSRALRARALPLRGARRGDRRRHGCGSRDPLFEQRRRSTSTSRCSSASRRRCCATSRALAPRGRALRARRDRARRGGLARAAPSVRGEQDVPDHHRRPHASAGCARATRWSAPGRCRWPTARSRCSASTATRARRSRWASARRWR